MRIPSTFFSTPEYAGARSISPFTTALQATAACASMSSPSGTRSVTGYDMIYDDCRVKSLIVWG